MLLSRSRLSRRSLLVVLLALVLTTVQAGDFEASARGQGQSIPYLALGDSLPYGWDPVNPPGPAADPSFHYGYPETLAARSFFEVTNASCPGETSGHFLTLVAADNGCSFVRDNVGLKVDWAGGSQLDFALSFLAANPDTGLVTIQLGANDLFLCQQGEGGCTPGEFVAVLGSVGANVATAVGTMRFAAYAGPIVLVGYYALDYADPTQVAISQASADVLHQVAGAFDGVEVADGFEAFEQASRRAGGDPCAAELLLPTGPGTCDIHTSPRGDRVMAQAVHRAADIGRTASGR